MNQVDDTPSNWEQIEHYLVVGSVVVLSAIASAGLAFVLVVKSMNCS